MASTPSTNYWSLVRDYDYADSAIVPISALGVNMVQKQNMAGLALKEKTLAVNTQPPITIFSLPSANQANSALVRAPGEVRNAIYDLCGFKDSRIHLYELSSGVKGFNCEAGNLSEPCLGSAPCHFLVGKINPMFSEHNKTIHRCPTTCECTPINVSALARTCQHLHNEILSFVYRCNMFVASKYVFGSILSDDSLLNQHALRAALLRIQRLQLDLGLAKYGSNTMVQAKHATLRTVKEHATDLRELCVTFTTCLQGLNQDPIDCESICILSRFRGLTGFKLVIKNARDSDKKGMLRHNENETAFLRAVPYIEDIFAKFVKLRDMDDITGLDKLEIAMVEKEAKFVSGLKKKVKAMLAEE
jgi:hypothetical protein